MSAPYTTNYCINPSFQQGMLGCFPVLGTEQLSLDTSEFLFGTQSLLVTTSGNTAGEGCYLPGGVIPTPSPCSLSVNLFGAGNVNVSVLMDTTGSTFVVEDTFATANLTTAASMPVTLTNGWNRVVLEGLFIPTPGTVLYLSVSTTTAQQTSFWVSGIQIEPESPAHPYIDGDQDQCIWLDQPYGRSQQLYQWSAQAIGLSTTSGDIVTPLNSGFVSGATVLAGKTKTFGAVATVNTVTPPGAMTDFAIWTPADPDPAQAYVSWNTSGQLAPFVGTSNWQRLASVFIPPLDYPNSTGNNTWNRAAYMAVGFQFNNMAANSIQTLTDVQVELGQYLNGFNQSINPSNYVLPREVTTIIKPDRLNLCPNPSMENGITGWSTQGSAAIFPATNMSASVAINFDDIINTAGTQSLGVQCNANGAGTKISIPDLIPGATYTVSAYAMPGAGLSDIIFTCGNGNTSTRPFSVSPGGYGSAPYGAEGYGDTTVTGAELNPPLNSNYYFATNTAGWAPSLATLAQTSSPPAGNVYPTACLVTPTGAFGHISSSPDVPVTPNASYVTGTWVYGTGTDFMSAGMSWFDKTNTFFSSSSGANNASAHNSWSFIAGPVTAPANAAFGSVSIVDNVASAGAPFYVAGTWAVPLNWMRVHFTFTATSDIQTLFVTSTLASDGEYPAFFWLDAVMVEQGTVLNPYFDGSFGPNYFWEQGGSTGLTRSYYYKQFPVRFQAFENALQQHTPYGISFATPQYAVPTGEIE